MTCPRCERPTTAIELRPAGRSAVAYSCLPCELTFWELEGRQASVDRVLDLVAGSRQTFMRRGGTLTV